MENIKSPLEMLLYGESGGTPIWSYTLTDPRVAEITGDTPAEARPFSLDRWLLGKAQSFNRLIEEYDAEIQKFKEIRSRGSDENILDILFFIDIFSSSADYIHSLERSIGVFMHTLFLLYGLEEMKPRDDEHFGNREFRHLGIDVAPTGISPDLSRYIDAVVSYSAFYRNDQTREFPVLFDIDRTNDPKLTKIQMPHSARKDYIPMQLALVHHTLQYSNSIGTGFRLEMADDEGVKPVYQIDNNTSRRPIAGIEFGDFGIPKADIQSFRDVYPLAVVKNIFAQLIMTFEYESLIQLSVEQIRGYNSMLDG